VKQFLSHLSVKTMVQGGFGLVVAIILLIVAIVFSELGSVSGRVDNLLESSHTANQLQDINQSIQHTNGELMTYLLDHESSSKERFVISLNHVQHSIELASDNSGLANTPLFVSIKENIVQLTNLYDKLLPLGESNALNIPAVAFTNDNVNPLFIKISALISQIISSANDELSGLRSDGETDSDEYGAQMQILNVSNDIKTSLITTSSAIRGYLAFRNNALISTIDVHQKNFMSGLRVISSKSDYLTLEQEEALPEIDSTIKQYFDNIEEIKKIHGGEQWHQDSYIIRTELTPLLQQVDDSINSLIENHNAILENHSEELISGLKGMGTLLIVLTIIGVVITIIAGYFSSKGVLSMINQIRNSVDKLVNGDLTHRMASHGSGEAQEVAALMNHMTENLQQVISEVNSVIGNVSKASNETASISVQSSSAAHQQREQLVQAATAVNEFNTIFEEVSNNTKTAATNTENAQHTSQQNAQLAQTAQRNMKELAREVEQVARVIDSVKEKSNSISNVLSVIRGISEQTNLLALNAAIEAARAGEHGRGFAVVADEVRTLATRTNDATGEIEGMINSLQSETDGAVGAIDAAVNQASSSADMVTKVTESLNTIAAMVEEIAQMNLQIDSSVGNQSHDIELLQQRIESINRMAEQTVEGAEHTHSAGNKLSELAGQLQKLVNQFKV